MAQFPAFPLWTDAYLADTKHLTTLEHGAYLLLLIAMWRAGGELPNDDRKLARFAGVQTNQWSRIRETIMDFMRVSDDGLTISQGRLADELLYVREHAKKQSGNARMRWQKDTAPPEAVEQHPADLLNSTPANPLTDNGTGDATASVWQCQTDAPTPTPSIETPVGVLSAPSAADLSRKGTKYPADFEASWLAYPRSRNMSKAEALPQWRKLTAEDRARVAASIPAYRDFLKTKPDLEVIHFCRYLSKRRFDGFATPEQVSISEPNWGKRLAFARAERNWPVRQWGPMPGEAGCLVPVEMLLPVDGVGWVERLPTAAA